MKRLAPLPSLSRVVLVACLLALQQCSTVPPTRLYILTPLPMQPLPSLSPAQQQLALGVGPVELPQYTNRAHIVTGQTPPEVSRAFAEQWAEPLQESFTRVLAENLSRLLGTERVALFPWKSSPPRYQVIVEVTHFLGDLGGDVSLVALWSLLKQGQTEALISKKFSIREATGAPGYAPLALAMSRTVAALSQEIATALTRLPAP